MILENDPWKWQKLHDSVKKKFTFLKIQDNALAKISSYWIEDKSYQSMYLLSIKIAIRIVSIKYDRLLYFSGNHFALIVWFHLNGFFFIVCKFTSFVNHSAVDNFERKRLGLFSLNVFFNSRLGNIVLLGTLTNERKLAIQRLRNLKMDFILTSW